MKLIKRLVNGLLRPTGYCVTRANVNTQEKPKQSRAPEKYAAVEFTLENIFALLPDWISKFEIDGRTYGGTHDYTTERISMLNRQEVHEHIDFKSKSVLEVGPLEAGNTIILERLGAARITSIEGRRENYLKCCVVKNLFQLNKSTFHFDDAMNAGVEKYGPHDVAFVAGLLYHLERPDIFLSNVGRMTETLVLSTHFADELSPEPDATLKTVEYHGNTYRGKRFGEGRWTEAGLTSWSLWPFREDLIAMIKDAGFSRISVIHESTDGGTNYKLIHLVAKKSVSRRENLVDDGSV